MYGIARREARAETATGFIYTPRRIGCSFVMSVKNEK
jgi:hypothetical protein